MTYYLVNYQVEIPTKSEKNRNVFLYGAEVMNEHQRHYALEILNDTEIYSVKYDVGEDWMEEIWMDLGEISDSIEDAKEISEEDYEAFQRMFDGTNFGKIYWDEIEYCIEAQDYEDEDEDEDDEEAEWRAAARECW